MPCSQDSPASSPRGQPVRFPVSGACGASVSPRGLGMTDGPSGLDHARPRHQATRKRTPFPETAVVACKCAPDHPSLDSAGLGPGRTFPGSPARRCPGCEAVPGGGKRVWEARTNPLSAGAPFPAPCSGDSCPRCRGCAVPRAPRVLTGRTPGSRAVPAAGEQRRLPRPEDAPPAPRAALRLRAPLLALLLRREGHPRPPARRASGPRRTAAPAREASGMRPARPAPLSRRSRVPASPASSPRTPACSLCPLAASSGLAPGGAGVQGRR